MDLIRRFWRAVLEQDRDGLRGCFRQDGYVNWHCTGERFTVEEFIRANCEYPGQWDVEIERVENAGDIVITVVRVYPKDRSASFHVVSFIRVEDGKVASVDEYWADDGEPPRWRREMGIGSAIRNKPVGTGG